MSNQTWLGLDHDALADAGNGFRLHRNALPAFLAMQGAAADAGIDCQLISSYRDFDRQLSIWNRKWRGELPLYSPAGELLTFTSLSDEDKLHAILTWSAMPGGSRHHWGTDIDVYDKVSVDACGGNLDLVDSEYCSGGPCYALAQWLELHAETYGFTRPFLINRGGVARELWHLSHKASAREFELQRNPEQLFNTLKAANIEGKACLLANFDALYPRYVLNEGTGEGS